MVSVSGYGLTTDCFEVWVRANVYYSVMIDTSGAAMDFGSMGLSDVKWSTETIPANGPSTATVTNNGNVTADWQILAEKQTNVVWDLRDRSIADKDDVLRDSPTLCLILCPMTTALANITDGSFGDEDMVDLDTVWDNIAAPNYSSEPNQTAAEQTDGDGNNVTFTPAGGDATKRLMFLRIKAPSDTTVTSTQKFRINVRAMTSGQF